MSRKPKRPEDFQKFYYAKVGLGEGCGCAERVIDMHEFDRLAGKPKRWAPRLPRKGVWRRFMNKAGLTSRPKV
ncbi:hypothetical protein [uncultured Roseobacter sp.]|uniref:hypothetical protein n=1 Tax=uncultured Roseobacter sp. TaxID=114847 RepID=UPI00262DA185|nr:hypothetical protein [uncultured Roseobacter sp.]